MRGDLISRSALFKQLQEEKVPFDAKINEIINVQPCAYDVEKVVAELEEKKELLHKMAYKEISKIGHSWDFECFSGQKMAYENAIEIVRNGRKE